MRLHPGGAARFGLVALGTLGLLLGSVTAAAAGPARQPSWQVGTVAPPVPSTIAFLSAVACSSSTDCVAGGFYQSKADDSVGGPMVVSESDGTWSAAQPLTAPAGSAASSLADLACASAGNCQAVGSFQQISHNGASDRVLTRPFAAAESAGSWAAEKLVQQPANSSPNPDAALLGVSCPAAGQCVAVGGYNATRQHKPRPMATAQAGGSWLRAVQITLPGNASRNPHLGGSLDSVACTGAGSCVAVGSYVTRSPGRLLPMAVIESHGRWGSAHEVPLPAGPASGALTSVSCRSTGLCVAVGYDTAGPPFALTERHGRWSRAVRIGKTGTGASRPMQDASSVSCGSSSCVVIGDGYHGQPLTVTFAGGKWSPFAAIVPPASAGSGATLGLFQVACTGSSACTAVGFLQPKHKAEELAVAHRS
jgi:hypothetical protein